MQRSRFSLITLVTVLAAVAFLCIIEPVFGSDTKHSELMAVALVENIWVTFKEGRGFFDSYFVLNILALLAVLWLVVFSRAKSKASAIGTMIALTVLGIPCVLTLRFFVAVRVWYMPSVLPIAVFLLLAMWIFWASCQRLSSRARPQEFFK